LMLSADETVYNPDALRAFCEQHRDMTGSSEEGYAMEMDTGQRFASVRLQRVSKGWRYHGKVHEYMAAMDGKHHETPRVPETYIRFRATDGFRRLEQQKRILQILEGEKVERPSDPRVSFYLASSYAIVGNNTASLAEYRRRVSLGGWAEEVYDSMYQIGWQLDTLKRPWEEVQQAWFDAHQYHPHRAEPLYWIAFHYWNGQQKHLAYMFAQRCFQIPYPKNVQLWVTDDIYEYKCAQLVGLAGFDIGEYEQGFRGMAQTYKVFPKDVDIYNKVLRYKPLLSLKIWRSIYPKHKPFLPPPDSNLPIIRDIENPEDTDETEPINQGGWKNGATSNNGGEGQVRIREVGPNEIAELKKGGLFRRRAAQASKTIDDTADNTASALTNVVVVTDGNGGEDDENLRPLQSWAWITIILNISILAIFVFGFIRFSRTKKLH